ncbi:MAG: tetratricopeptide repeat protein [Bacteroidetes bacterium]|nr:tetratricopeptide repeat protein [Bacteroidota bacterium]
MFSYRLLLVLVPLILSYQTYLSQSKADSLLSIINSLNSDTLKVKKIITLSDKLIEQNNTELAKKFLDDGFKLSEKITDKTYQAKILRGYAIYYRQIKYFNKSVESCNKALDLSKTNELLQGNYYHLLASIYENMSKNDLAIENYYKSIRIREKINDFRGLGGSYNNLGNVYNSLQKTDLAIESFEKSLEYRKKSNDLVGEAATLNNLGLSYKEKAEYNKAITYFESSLELKKKTNDTKRLGSGYNNLGTIYYRQNDFEKARNYYAIAVYYDNKAGLTDKKVTATLGIARCFIQQGNKDSSNYFIKAAETNINEQSPLETQDLLYSTKSEYDSLTNNFVGYIQNVRKSLSILKQTFNESTAKNMADLKVTFDIETQEKKIELLKKSRQLQETELKNKELQLTKKQQALEILNKEQAFNQLLMKQKNYEITQSELKNASQLKDIELLNKEKLIHLKEAEQQAKLLKQQRYIIYLFVFLGIFLMVVVFIIYKNSLQRKKFTAIILAQKNEVEQQKNIVEEKQKEIIQSIFYAKRIQDSLLPNRSYIERNLKKNG